MPKNSLQDPLNVIPQIEAFFDPDTNSLSYVVIDPTSGACAIIDSVLDYDLSAGRYHTASADKIIAFVRTHGFTVEWLIETHVHADHLTAAPYLKSHLGGKIAIGADVVHVQNTFADVFDEGSDFARDGRQFDHLFADQETYLIGDMPARAISTPGHTPACMTHLIGDAAFVGDTLFMPDGGTARADFPGGNARVLYQSIQQILNLAPETRLFTGHDYAPNGRAIAWVSSITDQRKNNIHVADAISEDAFVAMREARDKTLNVPKLIIPSIQVNMRAGNFPKLSPSGKISLKVPINVFGHEV